MVGNNRLYKHFKAHSLESQVRDTIEKNSKFIKDDFVPIDIVIDTQIDPIQPVIVEDQDKESEEKALLTETKPDIITKQTNSPKKGKKTKTGRNKKHGT